MSSGTVETSVSRQLVKRPAKDAPPPYPYGWFAVAFADELKRESIMTRSFMGREIVVMRGADGTVQASEAYCPHLGAHFGHGGSVHGNAIKCPFHGLEFGIADGGCTFSPHGPAPKAARLALLPTREVFGVVLVWHGPPGETPWEIELRGDTGGEWHRQWTRKMWFDSHPQEVTENTVDYAHFSELHGFSGFRVIEPLQVDGPRLKAVYTFDRPTMKIAKVPAEITILVDGLGFSVVRLEAAGFSIRQLVLTTPTGPRGVDVYVATAVRKTGKRRADILGTLVGPWILWTVGQELGADEEVWANKKYLPRPTLFAGDGPIGTYRKWARQFYPAEVAAE